MPIIPAQATLTQERSALRLAQYAARIQYNECAFWGVRVDSAQRLNGCREYWSKQQRDDVANYLAEAQQEIEDVLGYFLMPRWITGTLAEAQEDDRFVDESPYPRHTRTVRARYTKIIAAGVRGLEVFAAGTPVTLSSGLPLAPIDPIVITVAAPVGLTKVSDLRVFHPGTEVDIVPSAVTIAGGNLTVKIPRCRLVKAEKADNPATGWDYADDTVFESTLDLAREYVDNSVNAHFVTPCNANGAGCPGCNTCTATGCIRISDADTGMLVVLPATYTNSAWVGAGLGNCGRDGTRVRLNYLAGSSVLSEKAETAILRLAHAKMPNEPCGCAITKLLWERDRRIPEVIDPQRYECPFGLTDGAWTAYQFAASGLPQLRASYS